MTLTLAAVYAPIGLMGGLTGALFKEFAFTLASSVIVSGVIALTLSPMMSSYLLNSKKTEGRFARYIERTMTSLADGYRLLLGHTLQARSAVLVVCIAVMGCIILLFLGLQRELAPQEDKGYVFLQTKAPQYANISYTERYSYDVEKMFQRLPDYEASWFTNGTDGQNNGFGGVLIKPWTKRHQTAAEVEATLNSQGMNITGVNVAAFQGAPLPAGSGGLPVQMVVRSPDDFLNLYQTVENLKGTAWGSKLFAFVDSDVGFDNPQMHVSINASKAAELGITMSTVADTLATLVGENYINRFNWHNRSYDVIAQVPQSQRLSSDNLSSYHVRTQSGKLVSLATVVDMQIRPEANRLPQFNQMNAITISAVLMPGVTMGQAVDFLKSQPLPPGTKIDWLSDSRQFVMEGNQLTISFAFALIVIFLVLAAQYESLRDPLVILVTVPLAICGALIPLWLGYGTLNIYTQIGLVTLIGLISKHGILMVSFANDIQKAESVSPVDAIHKAAVVRMRPVLMTTVAMVAGLIPLLCSSGAGAASRFAIGIVVVTGMLVGTLFTLFVLPTIYSLLARNHREQTTTIRAQELSKEAKKHM